MRKRKLPTKKRTPKVRRQSDPIPWKYCILTLFCGVLLVAGFFYAARSHFASMDYAMKNAKLRKQIDELKSEKRLLKLEKEIALTPSEIKKAAGKLGLTMMTARNISVANTKPAEETDSNENTVKKNESDEKSKAKEKTVKKELKPNLEKAKKDKGKSEKVKITAKETEKTVTKDSARRSKSGN